MKNNITLKIIKDNYSWFIAILTLIAIATSQLIRFLNYIKISIFNDYFGLSLSSASYNSSDLFYDSIIGIVFLFCLYSMMLLYREVVIDYRNKNYIFLLFKSLTILFVNTIYLGIINKMNINIVDLTVLIFFEVIIILIIEKIFEKYRLFEKNITKDNFKIFIKNYFLFLPFALVMLLLCTTFLFKLNIQRIDKFRIIDENLVVLHYDGDNYIVMECEIINDTIKIYYGTQKRINSLNIETDFRQFSEVKVLK